MARPSDVTADPDQLPEALQFMRVLWALVHALELASKSMRQRLGVTGPQRLALRVVGLFPGISAGQLADILHVHPSTLTGVLQRLTEQGFLERTSAASDRRRAQLRLTARGRRINQVRSGTVESAVIAALRQCSARDLASTERLIVGISGQLERCARPARSRRQSNSRG
jgi:DNA-binding MarR family transcriptional regulator